VALALACSSPRGRVTISSTGSGDLPFPDAAPALTGVTLAPNLDSVVVTVPTVANAQDFRVFLTPVGTKVIYDLDSGAEEVNGTVIVCAGIRQHNAPAAPAEVVQQLEMTGITGPTHVVVEAIDRLCPFAGVLGTTHADVAMTNAEVAPADRVPFSIYTAQEIIGRYGSLVLNGHGPGPAIGLPAANEAPRALARTQLISTPLPQSAKPTMTFFDDFSAADQPHVVGPADTAARSPSGELQVNSNWAFYAFGYDRYQVFIDRGALHAVIADAAQDVFASLLAIPKRPAQLPAAGSTNYLHVTWEVESNATSRRYWWILMCGAAAAGQTLDSSGLLMGRIVPTSAFMEADGLDPSVAGWNCLHVFPRDGWPSPLAPNGRQPETDVRVMINKANAGGNDRTNVVNLSPDLYANAAIGPPGWYRQLDAALRPVAPMLDDLQILAPRVKWDLYVRRNRVVLYANGQQRLCNDFPSTPLTMAEGALAFSQVLYHSTAERMEFSVNFWDKRGQRYYLNNTPYLDERVWDNAGYDENVAAPPSFDASLCFNHG
jgi:hypothetical protein